jgi:hypothetical protein
VIKSPHFEKKLDEIRERIEQNHTKSMQFHKNTDYRMGLQKQLIECFSDGVTDTINKVKDKKMQGVIENILTEKLDKLHSEDPEKAANL